jgi:hypothetical protein
MAPLQTAGEWSSQELPDDQKGGTIKMDSETYKDRTDQQETFTSLSVALKIGSGFDSFWTGNFADHVIRAEFSQRCKRTAVTVLVGDALVSTFFSGP